MPYGFFGILMLRPGRSLAGPLIMLSLLGFIVAAGVQVIQLAIPARSAVMGDVVWNFAGFAIGVLAALPAPVRRAFQGQGTGTMAAEILPLALMACWLAAELAPFVPSIDFQSFKDSLKPLLRTPQFDGVDFLRGAAAWSVFGWLTNRAAPRFASPLYLALIMAGTLFAKILIVQNSIAVDDVAGMGLAFILYAAVRRPPPAFPVWMIALYFILAGLEPFSVKSGGAFHWIPFAGSLTGSMIVNLSAIAIKLYLIGALFLFADERGWRPERFWLAAVPALFAVEILQIWIGSHTAEITDPLLAAAIAYALAAYKKQRVLSPAPAPPEYQDWREPENPGQPGTGPTAPTLADTPWPLPNRTALIWLGGLCVGFAVILNIVMGLPQVPYNVRELFGGDNAWWRLFFFALAIFSIGIGGTVAGWRTARSRLPVLVLPGWFILATFVTYLLLVISVTN